MRNIPLLLAGLATGVGSLAHILCVVIGADAYRLMGAGEQMAMLAEQGHWWPPTITLVIASILAIWSAYALMPMWRSKALPLTQLVLWLVAVVLIARGSLFFIIKPYFPGNSDMFWWGTSALCLGIGFCYARGAQLLRANEH